jgi:hypothetical protein
MSVRAAAAPPASGLEAAWLEGIAAISGHQLSTGEIGSYGTGADGRLAYRRSLSAAIAVHEALACFDPSSAWEETRSVRAILPPAAMRRLCLGAARIRRRIREFLAWQELADHLWREGGKHGEMPVDPALSAAAALALMDDPARAPGRWALYARALDRFRGADGLVRTEAAGADLAAGADPMANARVAECLAVAGEDVEALAAYLQREAGAAAAGRGERIPLALAGAVARCWARAQLPGRRQLAAALAPGLLERLRGADAADASNAANTARLLLALIDLGSTSPEIAPTARLLLAGLPLWTGWTSDPSAAGAARCPSLTRALVLAAAARSQTLAEEVFPCMSLAS